MAKPPVRRLHNRFACDLPVEIFSPISQAKLADARLHDVGMGGGNVYTDIMLQRALSYELRLSFGKERLAVLGRVVWSSPTDRRKPRFNRYGVRFDLSSSQEALMRILIDRLRQEQLAQQPDGKLKDYWTL